VFLIGQCYYRIAATRPGHSGVRRALRLLRAAGWMRDFRLPLDALHEDHPLVRELMRLWSRIHWAGTDGMMPPRELLAIVRLAYACPVEGDTVELGSWVGLTTCYLAAACRARGRGKVFAVDTFAGTKEGGETYASTAKYGGSTYETFQQNVRASGLADRVQAYVGLTTEMVERHRGRPVRFLLIDADHSYDGVRADFECWSPLVAPRGCIVFHDYRIDDVRRFIDTEVVGAAGFAPNPGLVESNVYAVTKVGTTASHRERPITRWPLHADANPAVRTGR
jgi:predicted O-methyltransferase YrrM